MPSIRNRAENFNQQNSSGYNQLGITAAKGTHTEKNIIPAGGNQYFPMSGTIFYVEAASGQINISPDCALGLGAENPYTTGMGLNVHPQNPIKGLQIRNPDANNALFFQLKCGFDGIIDNRFISTDYLFKQVSKMTYAAYAPLVQSALVTITDLSGTLITDDNGNQWYAVNRQLLCLFNADADDYWFLQNTAETRYEGIVHPLQSIQLPVAGNFKLIQGTANLPLQDQPVNGVVTEIYNCLPKLGL